jgi:uncharacterized protein
MSLEGGSYVLLVGIGIATGLLNTVAGGGSFLSLPFLIFLGLPPMLANGTNRIAIVVQNVGGVLGFHRHGVLPWSWGLLAVVPSSLGSIVGTWLALRTHDALFKDLLALFMVVLTLWTLLRRDPPPTLGGTEAEVSSPATLGPRRLTWVGLGFFGAGVYGGFIQAGVGFLILAVTALGGLDLVRGNAVKVLAILVSTAVSLVGFLAAGQVLWVPGLVLAAGTFLGALLGVRLTVLKGNRWVRRVVVVAVLACAAKLWFD